MMIDIHIHILPEIDDGPISMEESMEMVRIAWEEGIRKMIVTPHRNHPSDFKRETEIEDTFSSFRQKVKIEYPELEIYLGTELFIREGYMEILDLQPYSMTLHQSRYTLIEFSRDVSSDYIQNAVFELKIRGYVPILAHVEFYEALLNRPDLIQMLKDEGAFIQVTAACFTGKKGRTIKKFAGLLLKNGLIDFIATDAHHSHYRRPLLKDAYLLVRKLSGEKEAHRIFFANPQNVIDNRDLISSEITEKKSIKFRLLAGFLAVALVLFVVSLGPNLFQRQNLSELQESTLGETEKMTETQASTEEILETEETTAEEATSESISTETLATEETVAIEETTTEEQPSTVGAEEAIQMKYTVKLLSYQSYYEANLERIVTQIKTARETLTDDEERRTTIEAYLDEIVTLEAQADNQVNGTLYEMQNELETYGYEVEIVNEMRSEYERIKEEKKAYYLNQI
ncbi:MAG: hypothetical protein JXQ26_04995 [Tissierellales bacterium]|nr:hypothetical protein [Tissierellales bacterium]